MTLNCEILFSCSENYILASENYILARREWIWLDANERQFRLGGNAALPPARQFCRARPPRRWLASRSPVRDRGRFALGTSLAIVTSRRPRGGQFCPSLAILTPVAAAARGGGSFARVSQYLLPSRRLRGGQFCPSPKVLRSASHGHGRKVAGSQLRPGLNIAASALPFKNFG